MPGVELIPLLLLVPLSIFIGISASAIGFTAWPLVVPLLFVLCGFDLYLTLFSSLLVDCGNALVMTVIAARHRHLEIKQGVLLTVFALVWVAGGIFGGRAFIPNHGEMFRGTAGIVTIIIGTAFLIRGWRNKPRPAGKVPFSPNRRHLIYAGVALMAFQIGLVGIGGGMGYAIFLMLFLSYPLLKATGTAMLMTFGSTLFAAGAMFFLIPSDAFVQSDALKLIPLMVGLSMIGTAAGAKIVYMVSERQINFLIGGIVVAAGVLASAQKYIIQLMAS